MDTTARPLFALYIVWHPLYTNGSQIADLLRRRFGGDRYQNIAGDPGMSVLYRSEAVPDELVPLPIDWDEADTTAVVVLVDAALAKDTAWVSYVRALAHSAQAGGFHTRLFPVMMEPEGHKIGLDEQALRWDQGGGIGRRTGAASRPGSHLRIQSDAPPSPRVTPPTGSNRDASCRLLGENPGVPQPLEA